MLTFMPSGRFTKTHAFCTKNENSNFCEAKPETLFGRVVCNEKLHTLARFLGALSLCMLVFCDLHGHLGGKAKLNHI
jgi:hypothetical protein